MTRPSSTSGVAANPNSVPWLSNFERTLTDHIELPSAADTHPTRPVGVA
jgi:hypothetical protein